MCIASIMQFDLFFVNVLKSGKTALPRLRKLGNKERKSGVFAVQSDGAAALHNHDFNCNQHSN
jgi:hypothetical protein